MYTRKQSWHGSPSAFFLSRSVFVWPKEVEKLARKETMPPEYNFEPDFRVSPAGEYRKTSYTGWFSRIKDLADKARSWYTQWQSGLSTLQTFFTVSFFFRRWRKEAQVVLSELRSIDRGKKFLFLHTFPLFLLPFSICFCFSGGKIKLPTSVCEEMERIGCVVLSKLEKKKISEMRKSSRFCFDWEGGTRREKNFFRPGEN